MAGSATDCAVLRLQGKLARLSALRDAVVSETDFSGSKRICFQVAAGENRRIGLSVEHAEKNDMKFRRVR